MLPVTDHGAERLGGGGVVGAGDPRPTASVVAGGQTADRVVPGAVGGGGERAAGTAERDRDRGAGRGAGHGARHAERRGRRRPRPVRRCGASTAGARLRLGSAAAWRVPAQARWSATMVVGAGPAVVGRGHRGVGAGDRGLDRRPPGPDEPPAVSAATLTAKAATSASAPAPCTRRRRRPTRGRGRRRRALPLARDGRLRVAELGSS